MMGTNPGGVPAYGGGQKSVVFTNSTTTNTTAATTTVTLPRSTKPIKLIASVSNAGSATISVQGLGPETYTGVISTNVPLVLSLAGLPESTSVIVTYGIFVNNTTTPTYVLGSIFYT